MGKGREYQLTFPNQSGEFRSSPPIKGEEEEGKKVFKFKPGKTLYLDGFRRVELETGMMAQRLSKIINGLHVFIALREGSAYSFYHHASLKIHIGDNFTTWS